jgi:hypothetical protein
MMNFDTYRAKLALVVNTNRHEWTQLRNQHYHDHVFVQTEARNRFAAATNLDELYDLINVFVGHGEHRFRLHESPFPIPELVLKELLNGINEHVTARWMNYVNVLCGKVVSQVYAKAIELIEQGHRAAGAYVIAEFRYSMRARLPHAMEICLDPTIETSHIYAFLPSIPPGRIFFDLVRQRGYDPKYDRLLSEVLLDPKEVRTLWDEQFFILDEDMFLSLVRAFHATTEEIIYFIGAHMYDDLRKCRRLYQLIPEYPEIQLCEKAISTLLYIRRLDPYEVKVRRVCDWIPMYQDEFNSEQAVSLLQAAHHGPRVNKKPRLPLTIFNSMRSMLRNRPSS